MIWRPMVTADLATVERIGEIVHPTYPERPEVPRERLALYPAGCCVAGSPEILGYAVSHPGIVGQPPALDTLLGRLPAAADCLYLHDVALLPAARGGGLGRALVERLRALAAREGLSCLALIAVNRSVPYWSRFGFAPPDTMSAGLRAKLASYDGDAAYLVRRV